MNITGKILSIKWTGHLFSQQFNVGKHD